MIVIFSYMFKIFELLVFAYVIYLIFRFAKILQSDLPDSEKVKQLKKILLRKDKR